MNDDDYASLQAQIDAIQMANRIAKDVQKQLTDLMTKMIVETNVCGLCNTGNANTWLVTTCITEHVETTRVCKNCFYQRGIDITQRCVRCSERTLDWAIREDGMNMWSQSWVDE